MTTEEWLFTQWGKSSGKIRQLYLDLIYLLGYQWNYNNFHERMAEILTGYYNYIGMDRPTDLSRLAVTV